MSTKHRQTIGNNIRIALIQNGISQVQLSQHLNIPYPTINAWVNGRGNVPREQLDNIARLLNVEPNTLDPNIVNHWEEAINNLTSDEDKIEALELTERLKELGINSFKDDPRNIHDKLVDIHQRDLPDYKHPNKNVINDLLTLLIEYTQPQ